MAGKGDNGLGVDCFVVDTASVVPGLPGSLWDTGSVPVTFAGGAGVTGAGAADGTTGEKGTFPLEAGGAASFVAAPATAVSVSPELRNKDVLRPTRQRFDEHGVSEAPAKADDGF